MTAPENCRKCLAGAEYYTTLLRVNDTARLKCRRTVGLCDVVVCRRILPEVVEPPLWCPRREEDTGA